mmetsp:Transcript_34895/g.109110  ORF Transcript_34895/g.109110 Transcript_34895/m.109110 type:complete len:99 (+) Transcript_34895:2128-2424(+)
MLENNLLRAQVEFSSLTSVSACLNSEHTSKVFSSENSSSSFTAETFSAIEQVLLFPSPINQNEFDILASKQCLVDLFQLSCMTCLTGQLLLSYPPQST